MIGFNWSHFFGCCEGYDALKKGLKRNMIGSQLFWIWYSDKGSHLGFEVKIVIMM
jgi:hypothetical protein